ncbi:guanine nucleotide-releasing factor 2 isoform X2 [Drosophila navojoa]|uniref:guanine nucleotide-releasing factor 2 isoform X2 n=1 Tax=Drosophila navojoa TaxID=7232 RepID=UPI0011BF2887|nr:guanine nucleotide-releasing factor 2 isoform X2 [Drosophila navojoa]
MPQFDETFLSDCALAERWRFYSYTVKQPLPDDQHDQQQQQQQQQQSNQCARWSKRDNNNNNSCSSSSSGSNYNNNNNNNATLHDIKFHRRREYTKLPRLALSTAATTPTTPATTPQCTPLTPSYLLVKNVLLYGSISSPSTPSNCSGSGGGGCNSSSNNSINSGSIYAAHSSSASSTPPPQPPTTPLQSGRAGGVPPAPPSSTSSSSSSGGGGGGGVSGSSGHKNSLKGTKLARRARSFKDDLIEKISLMRTTNNTLGRSHSPHSPRNKHATKPPPTTEEVQRSTQTLETHVKDISNALKHFRDVILRKKLEVLPGNGTVILETIASMYSVIQSYTLNENSAIMSSATQQVYQSLGKLIKLCDEVMLSEKSTECASLSNENVREVIDLLEDAVRNLVTLAQGKLKEQDQCTFRYSGGGLGGIGAAADIMGAVTAASTAGGSVPGLHTPTDAAAAAAVAQRTSLPDIALTPKERDILEQSNVNPMRGSHSTESILRDTSPPPKPPLPNRSSNPPPLPPKRRSQPQSQLANVNASNSNMNTNNNTNINTNINTNTNNNANANSNSNTNANSNCHSSQANSPLPYAQSHNISINSDLDCSSNFSLLNYGVDRLSVRSRSPDENSQCSFDSALNHSREEEDQLQKPPSRTLHHQQHQQLDDDVDKLISYKNPNAAAAAPAGIANALSQEAGMSSVQLTPHLPAASSDPAPGFGVGSGSGAGSGSGSGATEVNTELRTAAAELTSNRHSNESGFVSMMSFRTSTQSVSKRSSEHSVQSSTKSSSSNSEIVFGISELTSASSLSSNTTTTTTTTTSASTTSRSNSSNNDFHQMSQTQRHITSNSSSSSNATATTISSEQLQALGSNCSSPEMAPALPPKMKSRAAMKLLDAAMDVLDDCNFEMAELRQLSPHHHASSTHLQWHSKHHSLMEPPPRSAHLPTSCSSAFDGQSEKPPPLPKKTTHSVATSNAQRTRNNIATEQYQIKKPCQIVVRKTLTHLNYRSNQHLVFQSVAFSVLAYMEVCSANSVAQNRHTVHAYNTSRNMSHSQTMNIMSVSKLETPPALPPKNYKQRKSSTTMSTLSGATPPAIITTPPASPKPMAMGDTALRNSRMTTVCEELHDASNPKDEPTDSTTATAMPTAVVDSNENVGGSTFYCHSHQLPSETLAGAAEQLATPISTPKLLDTNEALVPDPLAREHALAELDEEEVDEMEEEEEEDDDEEEEEEEGEVDNQLPNMLEEIDITPYLILKKKDEDGPEVKGGYIDALIVHASRVQKADNEFSEAFITTFRTFIQPIDVIEKLTHRYTYFFCQVHDQKQKAAKETFSLLVRVVNDLTSTDLTSQLLSLLVEFVYQLVCSGQLYLAKLLRNKFVEKVTLYKDQRSYAYIPEQLGSGSNSNNQLSLLDLKSLEIAEQMTLLDAELFQKIEIPEVLLFAKDQCEEKSPNLNKFTEHFNKMSYWARSKILRLQDAKEREKHVNKFIKIMKHLRKMNNYNSYLALLSALDSGPIRRLEWQKGIAEEVRSFCALIDSSSSFRAYRQALAETNPPCIPYIGLVLQDLTFVHVGNQDYVSKGVINFSKRWQQYNIIVNMKRFKKCTYPFRRNERIIGFFDNFKDFMGEEEMWQISERIKPRGRRQVNY